MKTLVQSLILFNKAKAARLLPAVSQSDNKSSRGRCLLLAGSSTYPGAGVLAASAALRTGSGYVSLAYQGNTPWLSSLEHPDFIPLKLNSAQLPGSKYDAILCGPGFGVNEFTRDVLGSLIQQKAQAVVVDADALSVCAKYNLFPLPPTWIATPHVGELARCLSVSAEKVNSDRFSSIRQAQKKFGCIVLLKGHGTLVASQNRTYKITSGNSALAKSGTGDVLAGMITALRAQGLSPLKATLLGAYAHGATANLWVGQRKDPLSMTASDVIEMIPKVFHILRKKYSSKK